MPRDGRLINQYAADHSQAIAGGIPILALDMYEHAFHIDFGANAKAYIEAFMRNVDWKAVQGRYEDASRSSRRDRWCRRSSGMCLACLREEVKAMLDAGKPVQIIDARPRYYVSRTQDIMDGAQWRDPERVQEWAGELSKSDPVVTFCVYGFHVGCQTAMRCATPASTRLHERRPLGLEGHWRTDQDLPIRSPKADNGEFWKRSSMESSRQTTTTGGAAGRRSLRDRRFRIRSVVGAHCR